MTSPPASSAPRRTERRRVDRTFSPRTKSSALSSVLLASQNPPPVLAAGLTSRLNLGFDLCVLGTMLVYGERLFGIHAPPAAPGTLLTTTFLAAVVWAFASISLRHYQASDWELESFDDAAMTAIIGLSVFTALAVFNFLFGGPQSPYPDLRVLLVVLALALSARPLFRRLRSRELPGSCVLIVGAGPRGRLLAEKIHRGNAELVAGAVAFEGEQFDANNRLKILGNFAALENILGTTPVSRVYIAGNALKDGAAMQAAITICERLGVPFALPAYSFLLGRALPENPGSLQHGYLYYAVHEPRQGERALKRVFDILSSALALWLLAPVFALVAIAIKLTSEGPVIFRQERVGLRGRRFHMLKFRSMVANAEALKDGLKSSNEQSGPVFKMLRDPRVTRVGRFIRKYSIDELPQLINVLRGDMSVVGPRPPVPGEVAKYEGWQKRRLSVRPGLTCVWQVSGRSQISFEEWMYLDMRYIDHWSLREDLRLILLTLPAVISGRGSS